MKVRWHLVGKILMKILPLDMIVVISNYTHTYSINV